MFRASHTVHHPEPTTALTASGFTLERGGSSFVSRGLVCIICLIVGLNGDEGTWSMVWELIFNIFLWT
jgi:hypothetical protein